MIDRIMHMQIEILDVAIWALFAVVVVMLWKLYRRGIDFAQLIMGDDGKLSWTKMLGCTGGIVYTYGFIFLIRHDKMTEWYFNGYGVICFGTAFVYKLNALKSPLVAQQTIRVDAPADQNVKIDTSKPQ